MSVSKGKLAADRLRLSAETQLRENASRAGLSVTADIAPQPHELQILQIELEMQHLELIKARDDMEKSLEKYTELYDLAPVGYFSLDREGTFLSANLTGADILGVRRSCLAGRHFSEFLAAADRQAFRDFLGLVFAGPGEEACEMSLLVEENTELKVQIEARSAASGQECRIVLIDMTERRKSEAAVRDSEERVYGLAEMAADAIIMLDDTGAVTFCNAAAQRMFGRADAGDPGQVSQTVPIPEEILAAVKLAFDRFRAPDSLPPAGMMTEVVALRKDGSKCLLELSVSVRKLQGACHAIGILRDLTERKILEARRLQKQKMESVGLLAGGIAHDINNILCVIGGYATLAEMNLPMDDPLGDHLKQIAAAADRGGTLTRSLLDFSRAQPVSLQQVDVGETMESLRGFLGKMLGADILLQTICCEAALTVTAGPGQIEQILTNLASNAGHAMPRGGAISITAQLAHIDSGFIKSHGFSKPGAFVLISVTDTGIGMDSETAARIFEPFYTTRPPGEGTGLGLALVYSILRQIDGYIEVSSRPGEGTTFTVYLPLAKAGDAEDREASAFPAQGGTETILLAEDDESVRLLTSKVLTKFGYKVITATDGEDAIDKFRDHKDSIKLLLLDVVMPGRNGKDTLDEIRKIRPEMPGVFMSSYNSSALERMGFEAGTEFIKKPFAPLLLKRRVREMLNQELSRPGVADPELSPEAA